MTSNRLFILSFKDGDEDRTRYSFDQCYISLVEIKDFNALIDHRTFFDQPVKNKQASIKSLLNCQEMMNMQQEIYYIIWIIKNTINSLVLIYEGKKI